MNDTKKPIPLSCRVFRNHDWTVTEQKEMPSLIDQLSSQVGDAKIPFWATMRPIVLTETCRKCGKVRVRVINDV